MVLMGVLIRSSNFGRCRVSGRSSEARCSEVPLYYALHTIKTGMCTHMYTCICHRKKNSAPPNIKHRPTPLFKFCLPHYDMSRQGRSRAIRRVGSLHTKSGPSFV